MREGEGLLPHALEWAYVEGDGRGGAAPTCRRVGLPKTGGALEASGAVCVGDEDGAGRGDPSSEEERLGGTWVRVSKYVSM